VHRSRQVFVHAGEPTNWGIKPTRTSADLGVMIVRLVTILATGLLLTGCDTEEGLRAQELLLQAQEAQAALASSTFDGSVAISLDGMDMRMLFDGATSGDGEWFALRTSGVPNGADVAMEVLVRGKRVWTKTDGRWRASPLPAGARANGTMSADAFHQLAGYVTAVRVTEHQLIAGKQVTTIAGEIDTEAMIEAAAAFGSLGQGEGLDLSKLGLEVGDIHAVLTLDERTHLLESAYITFTMSAEGKRADVDVRFRLTSANEPVELPSPSG
jgi:hypothetical protein